MTTFFAFLPLAMIAGVVAISCRLVTHDGWPPREGVALSVYASISFVCAFAFFTLGWQYQAVLLVQAVSLMLMWRVLLNNMRRNHVKNAR